LAQDFVLAKFANDVFASKIGLKSANCQVPKFAVILNTRAGSKKSSLRETNFLGGFRLVY